MEGHVLLSRKELARKREFVLVKQGYLTLKKAARRLGLSYRQTRRAYRRYREELLALRGDKGARDIIARHPEDVSEVEVDCPGIALDIDTVEDYDRLGPRAADC